MKTTQNKKFINKGIGVMLPILILFMVGFVKPSHAVCKISQGADTPFMAASPYSLRSVFKAFNATPTMQACKEIELTVDVTLEHTIVISGSTADEPGKRLVIKGNNHVINAQTSSVDKNGCAIVILSSNVDISDLHVLNGGVCVGSDDSKFMSDNKVSGITKSVNLKNLFIEKSPKDGLLVAKNTAGVVIGEKSRIYYSAHNAIHYMESEFSKLKDDSNFLFFDNTSKDNSVSFFQNGKTEGTTILVEGSAPTIKNITFTTKTIQGYLDLSSFSGIAEGIKMMAFNTNGDTPADGQSTFIGISEVQKSGFFKITTAKDLVAAGGDQATKGDIITLIPLWSESGNTNVVLTSTNPIQVKFTGSQNVGSGGGQAGGGGGSNGAGASGCIGNLPNGVTCYIIADAPRYFIKDPTFAINNPAQACQILKQLLDIPQTDIQISNKIDSDGDGIADILEDRNLSCVKDGGETSPYTLDSDGDGLMDGEEDTDKNGFINCYRNEEKGCATSGSSTPIACNSPSFLGEQDIKGLFVNPSEGSLLETVKSPIDHLDHLVLPLWNKDSSVTDAHQPLVIEANGIACTDSYPSDFLPEECKSAGIRVISSATGRHLAFDADNGDFCTELNPYKKDSDGDGIEDAEELWGLIYNPSAATHLYWPDGTRLNPDSENDACDIKGSKGRKVLANQKQKAKDSNGNDVEIFVTLVCVSDSIISNNTQPFTVNTDNLEAYSTNPISPDSDEDNFCDSTGPGCKTMAADKCPTVKDLANACPEIIICADDKMLYTKINPSNRDALLNAVKAFNGEHAGKKGYEALITKLKAIDPNGDYSTDDDGIPDVVENPWGTCQITQQEKAFFSNPFKTDSDNDGETDKVDPFPNDPLKGIKEMPTSSDCPQVVDYSNHKALYCATDWDSDGLYNCDENPNGDLIITVDSANYKTSETCTYRADSESDGINKGDGLSDLEERQAGSNPWNPDTDSDGLNDRDEVYGNGKAGLSIVVSKTTPGCYDSLWRYTDQLKNFFDTDPTKADTDGDGLSDGTELKKTLTNPANPDSDNDGLCDGSKDVIGLCVTGEALSDSGDFPYFPTNMPTADYETLAGNAAMGFGYTTLPMPDGRVITPSNPCDKNTDKDAMEDKTDPVKNNRNPYGTTPGIQGPDNDLDGIADSIELTQLGTDPKNADSDFDGLADGCINYGKEDMKGELCSHFTSATSANLTELSKSARYIAGVGDTDPLNSDTDGDGMSDGDELRYPNGAFKNPLANGTYVGMHQLGVNLNPNKPDTDGDGIIDSIEAGARFKSGACTGDFCCHLNGVEAVKKGGLDAAIAPSPFYTEGQNTNALARDTDGDELPDGNDKTFAGKGSWGEDLNCNGKVDFDTSGNPIEGDPRFADSNHDGVSDKDAICQNGICDPAINAGYLYAQQPGGACSNTMMPGMTVPATAADFATLAMLLAPLGMAVRMRLRRVLKK